jgi:hypothetical protein
MNQNLVLLIFGHSASPITCIFLYNQITPKHIFSLIRQGIKNEYYDVDFGRKIETRIFRTDGTIIIIFAILILALIIFK